MKEKKNSGQRGKGERIMGKTEQIATTTITTLATFLSLSAK